jgi:hypothetical protein
MEKVARKMAMIVQPSFTDAARIVNVHCYPQFIRLFPTGGFPHYSRLSWE